MAYRQGDAVVTISDRGVEMLCIVVITLVRALYEVLCDFLLVMGKAVVLCLYLL